VALALAGGPARCEPFDDPFALRNQLPFNLLFLDGTPRAAGLLERGGRMTSIRAAYESTFVTNRDLVDEFRRDDFATYGGRVTLPILETVAASEPGRSAYMMDGETLRAALEIRVGLGGRLEASAELPILLHGAGFLDRPIDRYHEALGLPDGGRGAFVEDRFVMGYVADGETVYLEHAPGGLRQGDLVLSCRAAALREGRRAPGIALGAALKLPTGDARRLDGSGHADAGVSVAVSKRVGRSVLHAGYSFTRIGGWALAPSTRLEDPRSLYAAWAFDLSSRVALVGQVSRSSGAFPFRAGSDLGRLAQEITAGARWKTRSGRLAEAALIENLDTYLNTPDIGLLLGYAWLPQAAQ
jgi:hypothetical protein